MALVALEEKHATRICAAGPLRTQEAECEVRNGMRVRRGKGAAQRGARNGAGQDARRKAFERCRWRRDVVWAREDRLDGVGLQVLDRILRLDEESRAEAVGSGDEEGCARQRPSADEVAITLRPAASSSSPVGGGARHATTLPPSSPPPLTTTPKMIMPSAQFRPTSPPPLHAAQARRIERRRHTARPRVAQARLQSERDEQVQAPVW